MCIVSEQKPREPSMVLLCFLPLCHETCDVTDNETKLFINQRGTLYLLYFFSNTQLNPIILNEEVLHPMSGV